MSNNKIVEPVEDYGLSKRSRPKTLFSRVGIVGCGNVGQYIANLISRYGTEVIFIEISDEKVQTALKKIESELDLMIERWGLTSGEKRAAMSRIHGYTDQSKLSNCDLVIEAVKMVNDSVDRVEYVKQLLKSMESHVSADAIIATTSATLVLTELVSELKHKERCVTLYFNSTMTDAKIVEVARGLYTTDETIERIKQFTSSLNRTFIPVDESPGLNSIRLYVAMLNEACSLLMEGVSSVDDIDLTMKNGFGMTLGPFEMADRVGLDKIITWMDRLYGEFGDRKYKTSPYIRKLVRAHQFGRSTGKGFYDYSK